MELNALPVGWESKDLGSLATTVASGKTRSQTAYGPYPVHGSTGVLGYGTEAEYEGDAILVARVGANAGKLTLVSGRYGVTDNTIIVRLRAGESLPFFFRQLETKRLNSMVFGSGQPLITGTQLKSLLLARPPLSEQQAIAAALSDVDALIASLDRLIAKKRDLKQAAMQQLLTGQTRLPGFSGNWETKAFADVFRRMNAKAHQIQATDYQATGGLPVVDQGQDFIVGFTDRGEKRFQCPDGGVIVFGDHTCIVKFVSFDFVVGADGTQILATRDGHSARFQALHLQYRGIPPTGYNRHFKFLAEREFTAPSFAEQVAIAAVLSDIDAELTALEQRRDKTRLLKQGMMQELLTGRTRLV
jgi:type I restriction enzyme S subunit